MRIGSYNPQQMLQKQTQIMVDTLKYAFNKSAETAKKTNEFAVKLKLANQKNTMSGRALDLYV